MKYEKILTKQFLIKEYVKNKKSSIQIAKSLSCSHATVSNYLKKYSIEVRVCVESSTGKNNAMFNVHRFGKDNPNFKKGKYAKENCKCIICGKKTCRKGKCLSCANKLRKKHYYCIDCGKEIDRKRTKRCKECQLLDMPYGESHSNYKNGKPKCVDCGKQLGSYDSVRCKVCANLGENNPGWKDGASFELYPPEFNDKLKEKIRKRDNFICQNCGMTEEEHLIVLGRNLPVHHIDYDKRNCNESNLTTLCNQCNVRVNSNRNYWEKYFKEKLVKNLK